MRSLRQSLVPSLFPDDTVFLAESEGMLQRPIDELDRVCKGRGLEVG